MLLIGCESEKVPQEDSFLVKTTMTEDMQKIKNAFVENFKENTRISSEKRLKILKITFELYGKNNKQLDKEVEKIVKAWDDDYKTRNINEKLEAALKGLKLDYNQVLPLTREIEKAEAEMVAEDRKLFAPYKARAKEILEDIKAKEDTLKNLWDDSDGISDLHRGSIKRSLRGEYQNGYVNNYGYNSFMSYESISSYLLCHIDGGALKDSFLKKLPSPLEEDDYQFTGIELWVARLAPTTHDDGFLIFDILKNTVKNPTIERKKLEHIVGEARLYLERLAECIAGIQLDIADDIERDHQRLKEHSRRRLRHFDQHGRYLLVELAEKYPKFEDFKKQIDALSTRLAYRTYCKVNAARSLYDEWCRRYLSQMDDFFKNSRILAERLYNICKDEKVNGDNSYRHEQNMNHIAVIREITSMGKNNVILPKRQENSLQKIKEAYSVTLNTLMLSRASEPYANATLSTTFDAEVNAYAAKEMTGDMQKIKDAFVAYVREVDRFSSEKMLKKMNVICELYGKNNKQLHEKMNKIDRLYDYGKINDIKKKVLDPALKGLRLNYNQIPLLVREIENVETDYAKLLAPYRAKAKEILKDIQAKEDAPDKSKDEIYWGSIERDLKYHVASNKDDYKHVSYMLLSYVDDGTLKDSFLEKFTSLFKEKEAQFLHSMLGPVGNQYLFRDAESSLNGINRDSDGFITFDALRNDDGVLVFDTLKNAVQNTAIAKKELERAVEQARSYLELSAECIARIQSDVADDIDHYNKFVRQYNEEKMCFFDNSYTRELLVELVEKYPKFEDFEKQIDVLCARLAYRTYCDISAARFLYAEWRRNYLSQMDELFKNARILAERLYNICKNETTHEYRSNLDNIAVIKEIASMGPRLLSTPNAPLSQQKIKEAYKNGFMKTREFYLRHMAGKL
ncbi:hypothetical protein FACS189472_11620 [Alphaproteobacteria bacterium]|nr:hypothetical protein FACS189472_11620 [Alphaproteobacteria bacterium]